MVERELVVADPCALEREAKPGVVRHAAAPGTWHAWVRHAPGLRDRNVTLFAASDAHLAHATAACVPLGAVAVDSGAIAVADGRLGAQPTPEVDGLYGDHGAVAHTAFGDGLFPVRGVVRGGLAVAVRASLRDAADAYHRPPPDAAYTAALGKHLEAAGEARDYSPKLKLAAGDKVRHAKFGEGLVIAIEGDRAKIAFADDVRLLVHGR